MKIEFHRVLPFLSLSLAAIAQSAVSPAHFARAEGNASIVVPISSPHSSHRLLQIHSDLMGAPRTIHGMRFRRDGAGSWPTLAGYPLANITVEMSHAAVAPGAPSTTFNANHGSGRSMVFNWPILTVPATAPQSLPEPFVLDIPFTTPFQYNGSAPLCWDMLVTNNAAPRYADCDAASGGLSNPYPDRRVLGTGCIVTGNRLPATLNGTAYPSWQATSPSMTFAYSAHDLAQGTTYPNPGSLAFLVFGLSERSPQVPFPGGCAGLVTADYYALTFVSPTGTLAVGTFNLPIHPMQPLYHGRDLFAQLITMDPATNAPVGTNAVQFNIVAPFNPVPVDSVSLVGNQGATGYASAHFGAIVEFY